ncbi:MAG: cobalamin transport operon protein [Halolamina sp.]
MERWKQYGGLLGLLVAFTGVGLWGFTATGGALPYGERFAKTVQQGAQEGGGPLVDLGRGIVVAGPIRDGGLVVEWLGVLALMTVVGIGLYVYADRQRSDDGGRASR